MKDFSFGDFIYQKRKSLGLSQSDLAQKLGISNKANSKWETSTAKPSLQHLAGLAKALGVSFEELLSSQIANPEKKITKIVVTGGPCAGKSTAQSWIQQTFEKKGYAVLFVPESATELITSGVAPWTLESNFDFQNAILKLQIAKENIFEQSAKKIYGKDKVLIVCDRGVLDNKAYMEKQEFEKILKVNNLSETTLRDEYDAVFHLVTCAKGAEEFYTLENNSARTETVAEAISLDDKLISAWTGHPHFRVIDNSSNFENKMKKLIAEISAILGEPVPYEIERKFLIEYPNLKTLEENENCKKVEIIQTYLKSQNDEEIRVRQRGENGNYIYTKTTKRTINYKKRIEIEKRLTKDEYLELMMEADTTKRQIRKTRYCLIYQNQYFEIDIYPFWNDKAIMEIELADENQQISFPKFIKIIKEVTDDEAYKNSSIANINI